MIISRIHSVLGRGTTMLGPHFHAVSPLMLGVGSMGSSSPFLFRHAFLFRFEPWSKLLIREYIGVIWRPQLKGY